ncbi:MAG TPA: DegT/DnrJ/EryC1/StrS family aminotransferase [Flavobacteriales bacterium]|nr:DegT/DnrJ/EryC1/StrS family aminotransferase [Flavobacteriales bacterium]
MGKIQMVDLVSQYKNIQEEVDNAILNVVGSAAYIRGSEVKGLEEELAAYLGIKHVITCGNGTDALQISLMALGLKPGDEVISASFTFIATVEVIALLGLKPVMVDVDPSTFNIDPKAIENAITDKTKAIIPVHLFGQCGNMDAIMEVAKKHDLYVIEDTAQAISAAYTNNNGETKKAGTIGHIGCTSFFPSKNLGCYGDGGAIFTEDDEIAEMLRMVANHGMKKRYYHEVIGVNSRLDNLQAAVLRIKLRLLDNYKGARNAVADFYDNAFINMEQLSIPERNPQSSHAFHQYTLKCNGIDRDGLKDYLAARDIPSMVYYPVPLHMQDAFINNPSFKQTSLPITEDLAKKVISLPIHTEMKEEQLILITETVKEYINSIS